MCFFVANSPNFSDVNSCISYNISNGFSPVGEIRSTASAPFLGEALTNHRRAFIDSKNLQKKKFLRFCIGYFRGKSSFAWTAGKNNRNFRYFYSKKRSKGATGNPKLTKELYSSSVIYTFQFELLELSETFSCRLEDFSVIIGN